MYIKGFEISTIIKAAEDELNNINEKIEKLFNDEIQQIENSWIYRNIRKRFGIFVNVNVDNIIKESFSYSFLRYKKLRLQEMIDRCHKIYKFNLVSPTNKVSVYLDDDEIDLIGFSKLIYFQTTVELYTGRN